MRIIAAIVCILAPLALADHNCVLAPPAAVPYSGGGGMATSGGVVPGVPTGVNENTLYQAVLPFDQYAQGYGDSSGGKLERIDNPPQEQPGQEENRPGQDQVMDHQLPDEQREGQVQLNKEIHNYQVQRKTTNINNRILHRYLKNLLVRTIYNTNIQKVNHKKLLNLLLTTLQETHQPKLLVKYSREDKTNELGAREEQPEVSEEKKDNVLPPIFEPATAEKIGYDGNALGPAVSAGGQFSSGGGGSSSGAGGAAAWNGAANSGSRGSSAFSGGQQSDSGSSSGGWNQQSGGSTGGAISGGGSSGSSGSGANWGGAGSSSTGGGSSGGASGASWGQQAGGAGGSSTGTGGGSSSGSQWNQQTAGSSSGGSSGSGGVSYGAGSSTNGGSSGSNGASGASWGQQSGGGSSSNSGSRSLSIASAQSGAAHYAK